MRTALCSSFDDRRNVWRRLIANTMRLHDNSLENITPVEYLTKKIFILMKNRTDRQERAQVKYLGALTQRRKP